MISLEEDNDGQHRVYCVWRIADNALLGAYADYFDAQKHLAEVKRSTSATYGAYHTAPIVVREKGFFSK